MKIKIDKTLILNRIKIIKKFSTDAELANFLGINTSTLSNWYSRNSLDFDVLFSKCEDLPIEWLIMGRDNVMQSVEPMAQQPEASKENGLIDRIERQAEQIGLLKGENERKNEVIRELKDENERLLNKIGRLQSDFVDDLHATTKVYEMPDIPNLLAAETQAEYKRDNSE
jgi:hypothetical protein